MLNAAGFRRDNDSIEGVLMRGQMRDGGLSEAHPPTSSFSGIFSQLEEQYQGRPIDVSFRDLVGSLPADELTHGIFPYPARLLRQIPRMLLACEQITKGVDYVLDPFCGSGTVLVEAQKLGLRSSGIEQNPIGALVSRVKTTPLDTGQFRRSIRQVLQDAKQGRRRRDAKEYVRHWYSSEAYSALARLSHVLQGRNGVEADALSLVFVLTAKKVANTDRRIPVPVRPKSPTVFSSKDVWQTWAQTAEQVANRLERIQASCTAASVIEGDARDPGTWGQASLGDRALVFTSPPYGAAQKYIRSTSLELGWLHHGTDAGTIGLERSSIGREHLSLAERTSYKNEALLPHIGEVIEAAEAVSKTRGAIYAHYFSDMDRVFANAQAKAARVVLISGTNTVGNLEVETYDLLGDMLEYRGYRRAISLRDEIRGRSLLTKRRSAAKPSHAEYVEVFEADE
ncbi:hypothetical protein J4H92_10890 [Leucobacter weissii]|uniref:DNA methylase N-4/N-6 domain-containing protein n=1 Tax=Leucobacter weissii TaxID=1983706 RepID=A0A939S6J7_9MICO|nr:DNA methyltransferase [Leucobacter weissii]MBO1902454.1 hypothetical protein [Leucobacter weissii]